MTDYEAVFAKHRRGDALDLRGARIGWAGAWELPKSKHLSGLVGLDLSGNQICDYGAWALLPSRHIASLNRLNLRGNQIRFVGVQALARNASGLSLTSLDLSDNQIGDAGAREIAESEHLSSLTLLDLSNNQIGEAGARALADSKGLARLTSIYLRGNPVELPVAALSDPMALRRHFRVRDALRQVSGRTVRCVLVGAPHAGKTTLARLLTGEIPDWDGLARTLGIEIKPLAFANAARPSEGAVERRDLEVQLWDCGGQSLQGMIHGLFFRHCPLFLLVLRSRTCLDQAQAWLDMIVSQHEGEALPVVLSVLNCTGNQVRAASHRLDALKVEYHGKIDFGGSVDLNIGPDRDNADELLFLQRSIRKALEIVPIAPVIQPLIGLGNLVSALPEPQYALGEFARLLLANPIFADTVELVNEAILASGAGERMDGVTLLENLMFFLEQEGKLVTFLLDDKVNRSFADRDGCVVRSPEWIQKGLYCLLPPEDDHPNHTGSAFARLAEKLREAGDDGLPGRFGFDDLRPVWAASGIPEAHHDRILEVLCQREVGLVIDSGSGGTTKARRRYFVPAYLEEAPEEATLTIARLRKVLRQSMYTEVLDVDLELANGRRIWPTHFFYRVMVWLSGAALRVHGLSHVNSESAAPFVLNNLGRNRMTLTHSGMPGAAIHLYYHEKCIWCVVEDDRTLEEAETGQDLTGFVDELIESIKDAVRNFAHKIGIVRQVPCPACLKNIDEDYPADAHLAFGTKLSASSRWPLATVRNTSLDNMLGCDQHHEVPAWKLRAVLPVRAEQPYKAPRPAKISRVDAMIAARTVAQFLYMTGMAKISGNAKLGAPPLTFSYSRHGETKSADRNTLKGYLLGDGGDSLLEPFCEHLFSTFEIVPWLAGANFSEKVAGEAALSAIYKASTQLIADSQAAIEYWMQRHPTTKLSVRSDWPGRTRPDLKIADFLDVLISNS